MKIFISYATQDLQSFKISDIVRFLEAEKEIEKVWYWDRDSKDFSSIISYMEFGITHCDVFLAISTKASYNSAPVNQEIDLAIYSNKKMIPVFKNIKDVRPLLRPKTGVKFTSSKFQDFLSNLFFILTGNQKNIPKDSQSQRKKQPAKNTLSRGSNYQNKKRKYKARKSGGQIEDILVDNQTNIRHATPTRKKKSSRKIVLSKEVGSRSKAKDIKYIHTQITRLERRIDKEKLSFEEQNKIWDEIDELEKIL